MTNSDGNVVTAAPWSRDTRSVRVQHVEWTDARVAELHAELDAETGALYRTRLAKLSRPEREAALDSLAIDPAAIEITLLITDAGTPIATGAARRTSSDPDEWEVKRVYVVPSHRGRGISRSIMADLEAYASGHGALRMVLQTGDQQIAAVSLYRSLGYQPCEPYPPYGFLPGELTFRKVL